MISAVMVYITVCQICVFVLQIKNPQKSAEIRGSGKRASIEEKIKNLGVFCDIIYFVKGPKEQSCD